MNSMWNKQPVYVYEEQRNQLFTELGVRILLKVHQNVNQLADRSEFPAWRRMAYAGGSRLSGGDRPVSGAVREIRKSSESFVYGSSSKGIVVIAGFERPIVVVDCETTGLDPRIHFPVEVAWWNLCTDERGLFVPPHNVQRALIEGAPESLEINRYREDIAWRVQDTAGTGYSALCAQLSGNTLAGSNPAFDARFLEQLMRPVWHHRLWDLAAYAAGILKLKYTPGLYEVCTRLGIDPPDHTGGGDVTATGNCFLTLFRMIGLDPG